MSAATDMERGDAVLAGEYVLGLLEGQELLTARGRVANDAEFAALVAEWEDRLAPLLDEIAGREPSAELWQRIEAAIGLREAGEDSRVVELSSQVRRWKWVAGLTSAAAAVALAFLALTPTAQAPTPDTAPPTQVAVADPLVAQVAMVDGDARLDVTYLPESRRMMVGAVGLELASDRDHELWLLEEGATVPQSLGLIRPGQVITSILPEDVARNIASGAQVLLTEEPLGGKPEGVDPGPLVASGAFSEV